MTFTGLQIIGFFIIGIYIGLVLGRMIGWKFGYKHACRLYGVGEYKETLLSPRTVRRGPTGYENGPRHAGQV
jgi:hypothetical protein